MHEAAQWGSERQMFGSGHKLSLTTAAIGQVRT